MLAGFVVGCASQDPATTGAPEPPGTIIPPCPALVSGLPSQGQAGIHRYGPLHWTFHGPAEPFIDVVDRTGDAVFGSVSMVGHTATWTPDLPLDGAADYQAQLSWCDDPRTLTVDFTTAEVPFVIQPPPPGSVAAPVYVVDIGSGNVVEPPGVGSLFSSLITIDLLVGVLNSDATSLELHAALAVEDSVPPVQDV